MPYSFNPFSGVLDQYGPVLTGSGTVSAAADGTAALPGIAFTNDLNTGIYRPGADQLAISTNSSQRLLIDASGNVNIDSNTLYVDATNNRVGLGTSSPSSVLDVQGTGTTALGQVTNSTSFTGGNNFTTPHFRIRNSTNTAGEVSRFAFLVGNGGQVYLDSILENATTGYSSFAIRTRGADTLGERLRIDSSGRVGIGTTSPGSLLTLNDPGTGLQFSNAASGNFNIGLLAGTGNANAYVYQRANASLLFGTNNTEAARIDSSGRLLVGTSGTVGTGALLQSAATSGVAAEFFRFSAGNDFDGALFYLTRSKSGTVGTTTPVDVFDGLGAIVFRAAGDSSTYVEGAKIAAYVDTGTVSASSMPSYLTFATTSNGSATPSRRLMITSSGIVCVGSSSANNTTGIQSGVPQSYWVSGTATTSNPSAEFYGNATTTRHHIVFSNGNGVVGSISTNASATAYNTSSDYRLKENVVPLTGAIDRLNDLQVHRFNFIADPDKTVDGFLAHEAQAIVPECVTGTKDEVDDEGNPVYQGIDQSKLVPLLTAALQEALAEIESLKARVTALEP